MLYLQTAQSPYSSIFFLIAVIGVFYFFILRPQLKKQKDQKTFESSIAKGNIVVTNGGIVGKINKIVDNRITIETAGKTHIEILTSAISKEMTDIYNTVDDKKA